MKFKKTSCIMMIFIVTLTHKAGYTEPIEEVIKKANNFLKTSRSIQGNFELIEGDKTHKGHFLFKQPQYLKMMFKDDKVIIFDGKSIWAHFPEMQIVIDQDINKKNDTLQITIDSLDINYFTKHYNFSFKKGYDRLRKVKELNEEAYIIEFIPKNMNYGFSKLLLYIRDDGFIVRSVGINYNNKVFVLTRKNLVLNREIDSKVFAKEIPKDAKIIKNPFTTGRHYKY